MVGLNAVTSDGSDTDGNKPRVLLAEDNTINQKVAHLMLDKMGYRVDVVSNGHEALDAVAQNDYVAILMDVQMPEMDGLEATRRIRAEDSPARNPQVPIIALTAHALDQDRQRSLDAGMDDHVSKPIDSEIIAKILARHIGRLVPVISQVAETPAKESHVMENLEDDISAVHIVPIVRV